MKKWIISIVCALLIFAQLPFTSFANEEKVDVVALGDSLAFGMLADKTLGKGYGDYVALLLEEIDRLNSFNKGFSKPGYTTTDILNDFDQNVEKPSLNHEQKQGEASTITEAIKEAEVITLSIGANDVLSYLKRNDDGTFTFNILEVQQAIMETANKIDMIFKEIHEINPDAQIIVMGYYNPFPTMTQYAFELNLLVNTLDSTVKGVVEKNGATFIDVKKQIAENAKTFVPNPEDIHLSEEGYKFVGQQMFENINLYSTQPVEPIVMPIDIEDHWGKEYIIQAIEKGIFNGYGDGTFKPDKPISRLEVTSIIARTFELAPSNATLPFTDLTNSYAPMVEELKAVYSARIVLGDGKGNFNPASPVTREEIALMLMRASEKYYGIPFIPKESTLFGDVGILSDESKRAISFLYEKGAVELAKEYYPKRGLTRAEAAKIFSQLKKRNFTF